MTFEQFQATRRHTDDLEAATGIALYSDPVHKVPGFVYTDDLHIEERHPNWSEGMQEEGRYCLVIFHDVIFSDDLEALERKLFEFANDDGFWP